MTGCAKMADHISHLIRRSMFGVTSLQISLSVTLLVGALLSGCVTGEPYRVDMHSNCGDAVSESALSSETMTLLTLNASHGRKTAWNQMLVSTHSKQRCYPAFRWREVNRSRSHRLSQR